MAKGHQIVGEKALMKRLNALSSQGKRNRIARPAIREASGEIRKKAKANAPKETGLLKKSIKNVVRTGKTGVYAVIGPANGFKQEVVRDGRTVMSDPAKYAHLVEYGTTHSAAKPYLRPAYDTTPSEQIIARRMGVEFDKVAKREAAKR